MQRDLSYTKMRTKLSNRTSSVLVFWLLLGSYAYVNQGGGYNENSRLDLLHAVVIERRLNIDSYHGNTGDKASVGGKWYSEKAPGTAMIALPAFLLGNSVLRLVGIDVDSATGWKVSKWIATTGSVGIVGALGGLALFWVLRRHVGMEPAFLSTIGVFLGSLPFPYATMLFSHAGVIGLLTVALWSVDLALSTTAGSRVLPYVAGTCCGLAIACEYPAVFAVCTLGAWALKGGWSSVVRFGAGTIPGALLVLGNNWLVTGSPLDLPYAHVLGYEGMGEGFMGIGVPDMSVIYHLLFSQYRGLFFWSPLLLLCVPGYVELFRRRSPLFAISLVAPVIYVTFVSSYFYWDGGWALGPRHLSAAIPFLAIAAGFGMAQWPVVGRCMAGVSIVVVGFGTFITALPRDGELQPLTDFYWQEIREGRTADTLATVLGMDWAPSFALWLVVVGGTCLTISRSTNSRQTLRGKGQRKEESVTTGRQQVDQLARGGDSAPRRDKGKCATDDLRRRSAIASSEECKRNDRAMLNAIAMASRGQRDTRCQSGSTRRRRMQCA